MNLNRETIEQISGNVAKELAKTNKQQLLVIERITRLLFWAIAIIVFGPRVCDWIDRLLEHLM
jgi:hypothetical protein